MHIVVPKETWPRERRVAATPDSVGRLKTLGFTVLVQSGAGEAAGFDDEAYVAAGAEIAADAAALYAAPALIVSVSGPQTTDAAALNQIPEGSALVAMLGREDGPLKALAGRKINVLSMNGVPRITRAQKMDALSSMANIAGYRAVIEAATVYPGFFGLQMTAAGKSPPARVLIIGAGVAGLAAIGAARSLGAEVRAFDVRPEVREQVQSMGATFLEVQLEESGSGEGGYAKTMSKEFIEAEMALFKEQCKEVDVIVTTALIPGRKAPILITDEMLQILKPGSVVVDLAAQNGGNCEGTVADKAVTIHDVTVIGYTDLPSRMAGVASEFLSRNIVHLLEEMVGDEGFVIDAEDEIVRGALFVHDGEILPPPPRKPPTPKPAPMTGPTTGPTPEPATSSPGPVVDGAADRTRRRNVIIGGAIALVLLLIAANGAPDSFIQHFTVFVLSCVVGYQVVWSVTPALHTPLMSVTNAISGIIIVGGLLQAATGEFDAAAWLGAAAILIATINIAGGFLVTQRMLQMFRK
ncbi:MAG: Re/Si-specific NAD(P)(+) transhydrogenase subunit alpha [Myxococcota bacterium]